LTKFRNAHLAGDKTKNIRPFYLTEASWAGSGSLTGGILTNLMRTWDNMKNVINTVYSMSMFGYGNTMVDVCGSLGPLDEELCARWM